ncbi:S-layer homology domain-containing protein [Paenibacillus sp. PR3]|uniref:S-layer homology domain-containing protein n=1 Tax=Paenibacillus terricola TaxID=2763503 RepID=A0ABR8MN32_9BACL|nr:S-layer homology domain-containing protein [Paenibacillus terricola]MBD3917358.1 S-layer homology domain-containing protein [Paenibacillus terricola]
MKNKNKLVSAAMGTLLLINPAVDSITASAADHSSVPLPTAPAWGHFVDGYKNNIPANMTLESNPAIGVLSGFLKLWTPGTSWDNGTKLNSEVLDYNIQYVANLSKTRTKEMEDAAYYDDRRNQTYGAIDGLGSLADVYRSTTNTYTTIANIPEDATTVKYNDGNGENKGGSSDSSLGKMVDLIGIVRGNYASSNQAKKYYSYMRPWRWLDTTSVIVPTLVPARSSTPESDGGFPSGHTNASYLASLALAYAVPERFQELLTRASEMGNNRIVAGMHSPLDVMGGRVLATALAASALADPDNAALKQAAYEQAHETLLTQTGTAVDRFSNYEQNKKDFTDRLTYGFTPISSTTEPTVVPKGAEVLLETRQPYLSDEQRREVLATTGLPSGYPLLDDPEGWGRLNLFAAADGYGAFNNNVTVTMDAIKGGFYAKDTWKNNIAGTGKLTKEGTGSLTLTGSNTYAGGTELNAGTLTGKSTIAFGSGDVANNGGTLAEDVIGKVTIGGDFTQAADGTLELNMASANDVLETKGAVEVNGKLHLSFTNGYAPGTGTYTLMEYADGARTGQFSSVQIDGLSSSYITQVFYRSDKIVLNVTTPTSTTDPVVVPGTGSGTDTNANTGTEQGTDTDNQGSNGTEQPETTVNPFQSNVVNRDAVLNAVNKAIAASNNDNQSFSDISNHWGSSFIHKAVKLGIITGYENHTFRPNSPVTRAEFTAMIARAFALTPDASASFNDTGSSWAAGYIGVLANKGAITGYSDGSFKPNAPISRAEMVVIISRILNLDILAAGQPVSFNDVSSSFWAANEIARASSANLVQGISASSFSPNGTTTRAEAATLIIRALESDSSIKALIEGV